MRLSDQELELVSPKGAVKGLTKDESKVDVVEGSSKGPLEDFIRLERKAKRKTTNAKRGHFKNFFMC